MGHDGRVRGQSSTPASMPEGELLSSGALHRRARLLVGLWVFAAPVVWVACWAYEVSILDEEELGIGGAGPDVYDYVDLADVAALFVVIMGLVTTVLVVVGAIDRSRRPRASGSGS